MTKSVSIVKRRGQNSDERGKNPKHTKGIPQTTPRQTTKEKGEGRKIVGKEEKETQKDRKGTEKERKGKM